MARFDDPSKFFDQLEDGIDAAWSEYVQEMQGQLSSRAPIDTGRLASSFFISEGVAVFSQRPENWAPPGAKKQVPLRPCPELGAHRVTQSCLGRSECLINLP